MQVRKSTVKLEEEGQGLAVMVAGTAKVVAHNIYLFPLPMAEGFDGNFFHGISWEMEAMQLDDA